VPAAHTASWRSRPGCGALTFIGKLNQHKRAYRVNTDSAYSKMAGCCPSRKVNTPTEDRDGSELDARDIQEANSAAMRRQNY